MYQSGKLKRTFAGVLSAVVMSTASQAFSYAPITVSAAVPDYTQALAMALYFFDANACGTGITDGPLTWRGDCHTYDGKVSLNDVSGLTDSEKAAVKAANNGSDTIDASGGYHDAGDHIKFSTTMGFACTSLAWSYFSYPEAFEKAEATAHLKYILRNMCDYFMKVTFLDSSGNVVAYVDQVAGEGEDHSVWSAPESQTMKRTVYFASPSTPIADSAGEMSAGLASASLAFAKDDPSYAAECLRYAKALSKFCSNNLSYRATGRGNMYNGGESIKDDDAWAKLWCDLAENKGVLPSGYTPPITLTGDKSYSNGDYDGWLYCWGKVYSGYSALLSELGYDGTRYSNEVKLEINSTSENQFNTSKYCSKWGWGSARYNCALQGCAWRSGDSTLEAAAKYQMDCILQSNTAFSSYVIGYGSSYPQKPHHRAANPGTGNPADNTSAKYVLYGALLGGPDSSGNYNDEQNAYTGTEPALDYNGCYVLALAPLVSKYGGNANAAMTIIQSASEINEFFDFGGEPVSETTTTTTTTETTFPKFGDLLLGDVDCNNEVNVLDAVMLARVAAEDTETGVTEQGKLNADMNLDGSVLPADLRILLRILANKEG